MSVGTAAMPQKEGKGPKEEKDQSVRLAGDVVRMARIIAAVSDDESMSDVISVAARPVLLRRLKEIQEKGFGLPGQTRK
jgi:hypothetical protein